MVNNKKILLILLSVLTISTTQVASEPSNNSPLRRLKTCWQNLKGNNKDKYGEKKWNEEVRDWETSVLKGYLVRALRKYLFIRHKPRPVVVYSPVIADNGTEITEGGGTVRFLITPAFPEPADAEHEYKTSYASSSSSGKWRRVSRAGFVFAGEEENHFGELARKALRENDYVLCKSVWPVPHWSDRGSDIVVARTKDPTVCDRLKETLLYDSAHLASKNKLWSTDPYAKTEVFELVEKREGDLALESKGKLADQNKLIYSFWKDKQCVCPTKTPAYSWVDEEGAVIVNVDRDKCKLACQALALAPCDHRKEIIKELKS